MKTTKFVFNQKGTSCHIVFKTGSESLSEYSSKEDALKAIQLLHDSEKISDDEFLDMIGQIKDAKNLQRTLEAKPGEGKTFNSKMIHLIMSLILDPSTQLIAEHFGIEEPPKEAGLYMCKHGGDHGAIGTTVGIVPVNNKENALFILDELRKIGHVNEEEYKKVFAEIKASPLE